MRNGMDSFKSQLNGFFETLQVCPNTVKMSGTETTIELSLPVKPEWLSKSVAPQGRGITHRCS